MPQPRNQPAPATGPLSVVQMADRLALSRRRFYELIELGKFPPPVYRIDNRKPHYPPELQDVCLHIRATGEAMDGSLILFNRPRTRPAARRPALPPRPSATARIAQTHEHADLIAYLADQGVVATAEQVDAALVACFPAGHERVEQGHLWREVYRRLRRVNRP